MAQELLQLVQSNPQVHGPQGVYEAYRRMYAALGIDNVEGLLQPPAPPPPPPVVDAGIENSGFMIGTPATAFPQQNHRAHIDAHRSLFLTELVKGQPPLQGTIIAHMMQHLQFMATDMATQQLPPELLQQMEQMEQVAQSGQVPPEILAPMQQEMTSMIEQVSAPILAQLTQELLMSIGQGDAEDPLVAIRQQELDIRAAELQQDQSQFEQKEEARANEKLLEAEIAKQRIDATGNNNDEKMDLAMERLRNQTDLKLLELQAKYGIRL